LSAARWWRALAGIARASAVLLLLVGGATALVLGQARATLGERLLGFGAELPRWDSFRVASAPRRLSLNGAELQLVSASTPLSATEALNRLERVCQARGGLLGAEHLSSLLRAPSAQAATLLQPLVRQESASRGTLACLDTGGALGVNELASRLSGFVQSGDLKDIGGLRYALAERVGDRTSVLFIWSDGPLPLLRMFPKVGDAPGFDAPGVPRPENSQRLLSAVELGAPYSFAAYRTSATLAPYQSTLKEAGFTVKEASPGTWLARRGEQLLLVRSASTRSGVVVSLSQLR
jgi:hypothetical protein